MKKQIDDYISKQGSPQKEICQKLRRLILKTLPGVKEEMRWGALVFGEGKFYIGALKDHVNLGFSIIGLAQEEIALFEGSGKTMRHIKVAKPESIDEKRIIKLLKLADKKSQCVK